MYCWGGPRIDVSFFSTVAIQNGQISGKEKHKPLLFYKHWQFRNGPFSNTMYQIKVSPRDRQP